MQLSQILAELALLPAADITPAARAAARTMTLDTLACMLAGWREPGVTESLAVMQEWGGTPQAAVLVHGNRLPLPHAVFVNSAMAHAWDYDDVHMPTALHIQSMVLPAALGAAQMANATGREFLDALILGVEVGCRLGLAWQKRIAQPRIHGFLPSSLLGGFGAAAAAGRLLGLDAGRLAHAFGLNYAQVAGNRQALFDFSLTKRLQPALAARAAVWSVALARRGVTAAAECLEGKAGLFRLYLDAEPPPPAELAGPRDWFEIEHDSIKPYACCGASHPAIRAALELTIAHDLRPADIEKVEIYLGPNGNFLVEHPFEMGDNPQVNAQFSAPYGVALAIVRRDCSLARLTDQAIRADLETAEFARRVAVVRQLPPPLPTIADDPGPWPRFSRNRDAVRIFRRNGEILRRDLAMLDIMHPERAGFASAAAKLRECAAYSGVCPPASAAGLQDAVANLEAAGSVKAVFNIQCPTRNAQ